MAYSPDTNLLSVKVVLDGSPMKDTYEVKEIRVWKEVNRIASAQLKLVDGSPSKEDFPASDSDDFLPGKDIELQAGFGEQTKRIFKGVITGQKVRVSRSRGASLIVECRDKASKMTISPKNALFTDSKDSDAMSALIGNSGLSADVKATSYTFPQIVQYYSTDWDFLLSRAEANGMIVIAEDNKIKVTPPSVETSPVATYTYGMDILDVDVDLDARTQLAAVQAKAWDYQSQSVVESRASDPSVPDQGNITGKKLSEVTAPDTFTLQSTGPLATDDLKAWADARLLKSRLAKIRGEVEVFGNADLGPDKIIKLDGLGKRFNGNAYISGIQHEISPGRWVSIIQIGLDPDWFAKTVEITSFPASALLPGIRGLQNAIVKQIYEDPKGENRVQVEVPMFKGTGDGMIWARWIQPYATEGAGQFFMPEIGDEVVLGFLNEDPRFPVILGSLYSSGRAPAYQPAEENPIKAIVTKSKITLEFDDQKKTLTIKTPGGNQIVLTDEEQAINIADQNGNKINLNAEGISMQSPANIEIKADAEVTISGTAGVTISTEAEASISGEAGVSISGLEVSISGETEFSASGGAEVSISAGGELMLNGAMIMIN